jgi:acetyl esterase/lipase
MRRMNRRAIFSGIIGLAFALVCAACGNGSTSAAGHPQSASSPTPTSIPGVSAQRNLAYGPLPAETLDLCTPTNATTPRPGIIMIHGGGWAQGDKQQYDDACAFLAQHGFVAATINYRLAPASHWPAQLVDSQLAVRWLRAHAAQYHLDTQRLCSWGDSAGAHLAVFLGVLTTIHPGDEAGLLASQASNTTCVVDDYGPVDLIGPADSLQQQILQNFIGQSYQGDQAAYRDASPLFLVTAHSPPMLIVQGSQDTLVPPAESLALQTALQRAHVPVQYITFPGGHAFLGLNDSQIQAILKQIYTYLVAQEHP